MGVLTKNDVQSHIKKKSDEGSTLHTFIDLRCKRIGESKANKFYEIVAAKNFSSVEELDKYLESMK